MWNCNHGEIIRRGPIGPVSHIMLARAHAHTNRDTSPILSGCDVVTAHRMPDCPEPNHWSEPCTRRSQHLSKASAWTVSYFMITYTQFVKNMKFMSGERLGSPSGVRCSMYPMGQQMHDMHNNQTASENQEKIPKPKQLACFSCPAFVVPAGVHVFPNNSFHVYKCISSTYVFTDHYEKHGCMWSMRFTTYQTSRLGLALVSLRWT